MKMKKKMDRKWSSDDFLLMNRCRFIGNRNDVRSCRFRCRYVELAGCCHSRSCRRQFGCLDRQIACEYRWSCCCCCCGILSWSCCWCCGFDLTCCSCCCCIHDCRRCLDFSIGSCGNPWPFCFANRTFRRWVCVPLSSFWACLALSRWPRTRCDRKMRYSCRRSVCSRRWWPDCGLGWWAHRPSACRPSPIVDSFVSWANVVRLACSSTASWTMTCHCCCCCPVVCSRSPTSLF